MGTMRSAPLSEATYLVLASLVSGPAHGYELIQRAAELSDRRVKLAVATLYTTLDRLAEREWIKLVDESIVDGRARRSFAITEAGRSVLNQETRRMSRLVNNVAVRTNGGARLFVTP
jgi:PadR family transcriptional regulator, regulatory protein PadR